MTWQSLLGWKANEMEDHTRNCVVVTGAASGIGYAVARQALQKGDCVAAVDLNRERLVERFANDPNVECITCDLTTEDGFKVLTTSIKERFAAVNGFVHAAGFDVTAPLGMIKRDTISRLVAIHADFPVQFLGWLAKKGNHAENAACVLISSLSAHEGAKGHVAYAAAKGALEGFLRPAAAELIAKGIRLNAVVLGIVETEMSKGWLQKLSSEQIESLKKEYPLGLGQPDEVSTIVSFLLSNDSRWIAGQTIVCDGGHLLT